MHSYCQQFAFRLEEGDTLDNSQRPVPGATTTATQAALEGLLPRSRRQMALL